MRRIVKMRCVEPVPTRADGKTVPEARWTEVRLRQTTNGPGEDRMIEMRWTTRAQDCLYVNWAIPRALAPPCPPSMSYEMQRSEGQEVVFVSVLLFRWSGHLAGLAPRWGVSVPQMHMRFYVVDAQGAPATLVHRIWAPLWLAPISTLIRRHPTKVARCRFPRLARQQKQGGQDGQDGNGQDQDVWVWSVRGGGALTVQGKLAPPTLGPGPDLGNWQQTVQHFRRRSAGYLRGLGDRVRSYQRVRPGGDVLPLQVEVEANALLVGVLPQVQREVWSQPHSAWVCPEIPLIWAEDSTVVSAEILREVWRREESRGVVTGGVPTSRNASP